MQKKNSLDLQLFAEVIIIIFYKNSVFFTFLWEKIYETG